MKNLLNSAQVPTLMLVISLLAACKVSEDVKLPAMVLPAAYRTVSESDTGSIARVHWKQFFADKELNDLVERALAHNNDLQEAVKNIGAATLTLRQTKLGNLPSLGLNASATGNRPSDNSLNGLTLNQFLGTRHIEDYTIGAGLSWEADIWGKIRGQKEAALANLLSTEAARNMIQTRIISDIAKGYYNLLLLDAQRTIALHNVALSDSTLSIINMQYQAGQVTSLAVEQADAHKLAAARLVPDFEQQISIQENAISILSGVMPSEVKRTSTLYTSRVFPSLSAGLPASLLNSRPDVRQAEYALARANSNVGVAKANLYPSFSISAQGGLNAIKASSWFNIPASLFGAVAGGLTQPIFNKRKLHTDYQLSVIERDKKVIQFRQVVVTAVGEVSDALVKLEKLKQQGMLAGMRTTKLKAATHNSQLLFKNGLANYLEVITAQSDVLQSELELSAIKKAQLDAVVDLYRSLGGAGGTSN